MAIINAYAARDEQAVRPRKLFARIKEGVGAVARRPAPIPQ
jgi:hypothetical protein